MRALFAEETKQTREERIMLITMGLRLDRLGIPVEVINEYTQVSGEFKGHPFVLSYVHGHLEICIDKEVKAEFIHILTGENK